MLKAIPAGALLHPVAEGIKRSVVKVLKLGRGFSVIPHEFSFAKTSGCSNKFFPEFE